MMGKISMGVGFAAGYVLGARAGRERYEQLKQKASQLAQRPQVKQVTQRLTDATTGKLQQNERATAGLQKVRGFATGMGRRRRIGTREEAAEATLAADALLDAEPPLGTEAPPVPDAPVPPVEPVMPPQTTVTEPADDVARPRDKR
jgi:hypothetical protein